MNRNIRRILTPVLIGLLCLPILLAGCSADDSGKGTTFDYWLANGIDSYYYSDYRDSPVYTYLLNKSWETSRGDVQIDFNFMIPPTGAQRDNFNTLLATGDYADILDLSFYTGTTLELYEEGILMDITEYVEQYMPNYLAWLDAHPNEKLVASNLVDGEKKYLTLYSVADVGKAWCGYMYRRDWILDYGTNPFDDTAFSGEYSDTLDDGSPDPESWQDNIVFPSGGSDPVYISDWEWMFEIFDAARDAAGITDGYNISLYYPGYLATGDLVCSFGGGGATWYKNLEGEIVFGPTDDQFQVYLQAMNTWYDNGWIDKAFSEHTSDMFFRYDEAKVRQGKVGMWIGLTSQLFSSMDTGDPLTEGIIVYPAPSPINDIYGGPEHQNKTPYTMYSNSILGPAFGITDKAADKDLEALFRFFDYIYTDEGALAGFFTAEQIAELNHPIYERFGLEDGTFNEVQTADGVKLTPVDAITEEGGNLKLAVMGKRGLSRDPNSLTIEGSERWEAMRAVWITYPDTGNLQTAFIGQLSLENGKVYSKTNTVISEFLERSVPDFIKGNKDPYSDDDWQAFVNAANKYDIEQVTQMLQELLVSLS